MDIDLLERMLRLEKLNGTTEVNQKMGFYLLTPGNKGEMKIKKLP